MTDNNPLPNENPDFPPGFTDLSGPAAFRAHQKKAAEEAVPPPEGGEPPLTRKIEELEAKLAETTDHLLRTLADMENLRKRSVREREDAGKYAVAGFSRELLDVADTFRRAIDSISADLRMEERITPLVEGIEATERALLRSFEKYGIRRIDPMGEPFDPNFHEVMFETPVPGKPGGVIVQVLEPGFVLHDRLLRPARVGVSKGEAGEETPRHLDTNA